MDVAEMPGISSSTSSMLSTEYLSIEMLLYFKPEILQNINCYLIDLIMAFYFLFSGMAAIPLTNSSVMYK